MKFNLLKIQKKFKLQPINNFENEQDFDVEIEGVMTGVYEFLGFNKNQNKIVVLGKHDYNFLKTQNTEVLLQGIKNLKQMNTPFIIFSPDFKVELLLKICNDEKLITFQTEFSKHELLGMINPYFFKKNAKKERIHGSLVNVYGEGILILGKSGIGKSELVLDLAKNKHLFVGDDGIDILKFGDSIFGQSSENIRNFLEIRGLGIVNISKLFGIQATLKETKIDLIIELEEFLEGSEFERLGHETEYKEYFKTPIPYIKIPVSKGRNLTSIVEAAVTLNKQRKINGYIPLKELQENLINFKNEENE